MQALRLSKLITISINPKEGGPLIGEDTFGICGNDSQIYIERLPC